ncbi:MAG: hypothetical protein AB7I30_23610 [Isosphaeraceae bacterium]
MIRLENLFQFIVPLTFLAIWAITSLFNREAQPPPPRRARPPRPQGWESGESPGSTRPPAGRDPRASTPNREARPFQIQESLRDKNEDILIIEADPRSSDAPARVRPGRGGRTAGPGKGRVSRFGLDDGERRDKPARKSAIEGIRGAIDGSTPVQSEALKPINLAHELTIKGSLLTPTSPTDLGVTRNVTPTAFGVPLTRENLRKNFLISEVLFRPPVGLRGRSLVSPRSGLDPIPPVVE